MARELLGFLHGGGGGERAGGHGGALYPHRGAMERGGAGGGHGDAALVAAVLSLSPQEEGADRGAHLSGFYLFPFYLIPARFRQLIEALKHFLKFWKNSQSQYITFGTCDKICSPFGKHFMC